MSTLRHPRICLVLLGAALLSVVGYLVAGSPRQAPASSRAVARGEATSPREAPTPRRDDAAMGRWARYRLTFDVRAVAGAREIVSEQVAGTWTTTERADGLVEARLGAVRLDVVGQKAPPAGAVAAPFILVKRDDALAFAGFAAGTPDAVKNLLGSLAAALQVTLRAGDAWAVEEQDLTGSYEARYVRRADRVVRSRGVYTRLHGAGGNPSALASDEHTEIVLDAQGVVSMTVKLDQTLAVGRGLPTIRTASRAVLVREDAGEAPLAAGPDWILEPLVSHVDHAAVERNRAERLVAGASAERLLDDAQAAAHLDAQGPSTTGARATALRRLAALTEIDASAPAKLAGAIQRDPGDARLVSLIAGALSSSRSPAATDALSSLLQGDLPPDARDQILMNLALAKAPTEGSASALEGQLDSASGRTAALALGAQAGKLGDDGAGGDAIDALLRRYEDATTLDEKLLYLDALANTGSRRALPVMQDAIRGDSFPLASAGAFGLRRIPGDDVDDLLDALIQNGTVVAVPAIKATAYRSPGLWQPRLVAFQKVFEGDKRVADAIQAVLVTWAELKKKPSM